MEKWMCFGSMGVAGLFLLIFILDIAIGIPFSMATPEGQSSPYQMVDIFGILGSGLLLYLSFTAWKDIR